MRDVRTQARPPHPPPHASPFPTFLHFNVSMNPAQHARITSSPIDPRACGHWQHKRITNHVNTV
eukprot:1163852-Prymnesium_polylepis.1